MGHPVLLFRIQGKRLPAPSSLKQKPMNHSFRAADWAAELALPEAGGDGGAAGPVAGGPTALPRQERIPNACDLRVYAVTDPDCNEKFGRGTAGVNLSWGWGRGREARLGWGGAGASTAEEARLCLTELQCQCLCTEHVLRSLLDK